MNRILSVSMLGLALFAVSPQVIATGLSMNEVVLPAGASLDACKAAGRTAIAGAGLQAIPEAPASVFGTNPAGDIIAIYCLPGRGIAVIAVAGTSNDLTRPILARLMEIFKLR